MPETSAVVEVLRRLIQNDPAPQKHLSEILDAGEFITAVSQLAVSNASEEIKTMVACWMLEPYSELERLRELQLVSCEPR